MIHVLLSETGTYRDIVEHLAAAGARITNIGPGDAALPVMRSKRAILGAMLSPSLLRLRTLWRTQDRLLVVGWQALPVLALIRMGLLPRPQRLLVMGCFVHGARARSVVNRAWRLLNFPGLEFIAFSEGEKRNLTETVGIAPAAVHFHLWRQQLDGAATAAQRHDDGSIFAGGFSNRDYDLLLEAARPLDAHLVIVASAQNQIAAQDPTRTSVHLDLPEAQFEILLARSRVVAMPLKSQGEACGQSVVLRVLRNGKPLIATRHEAIEAYLGADYAGFVAAGDSLAMREGLRRALCDPHFRAQLAEQVSRAAARLEQSEGPGQEVERFLLAP
ncbi:glycosyltransferase family protein [Janthinobacterium aquaticum]|uniref:hypothetical protein n=1 Tax=Janthinobacterium sp. FT58W TaxID=2654254 RepID=UPI0012652CA8|nr:hypothetical protein [Janthinobacterium sp. FT58W]KAB8041456.1 hypothetical protein GCM43_18735 [Janthinobacterium sp. FT58W]